MQKFLVIQTAFIGDVVLATSLAEKLHSFFPEAQIDFLLRKGNEGLLANHPYITNVLVWNKKQKYRSLWQLLKIIRHSNYDKVINVQRYAATGLLTIFSGAKDRIGFDKNPLSFAYTKKVKHVITNGENLPHEVERNFGLINDFTDASIFKPRLYPSEENFEAVAHYKQKSYICIAPASVWYTKQYPADKWQDLIEHLPESLTIYLLGGPSELALCQSIAEQVQHPGVSVLAGKLNFLESAALMRDAVMNYVNDSAPMHFASAMNAPVTVVYCSTIPAFGYGPLSDRSIIVQTAEKLACRPCGLHGHKACPEGHFKCAYTIQTSQLIL